MFVATCEHFFAALNSWSIFYSIFTPYIFKKILIFCNFSTYKRRLAQQSKIKIIMSEFSIDGLYYSFLVFQGYKYYHSQVYYFLVFLSLHNCNGLFIEGESEYCLMLNLSAYLIFWIDLLRCSCLVPSK